MTQRTRLGSKRDRHEHIGKGRSAWNRLFLPFVERSAHEHAAFIAKRLSIEPQDDLRNIERFEIVGRDSRHDDETYDDERKRA